MHSINSKLKPDYHDLMFRGKLMQDGWTMLNEPEHAMIQSANVAEIHRASNAITTIAMLLKNSLSEPAATGTEPLGPSAHDGLIDALQIVGKYLHEVGEQMNETSNFFRDCERASGGPSPEDERAA